MQEPKNAISNVSNQWTFRLRNLRPDDLIAALYEDLSGDEVEVELREISNGMQLVITEERNRVYVSVYTKSGSVLIQTKDVAIGKKVHKLIEELDTFAGQALELQVTKLNFHIKRALHNGYKKKKKDSVQLLRKASALFEEELKKMLGIRAVGSFREVESAISERMSESLEIGQRLDFIKVKSLLDPRLPILLKRKVLPGGELTADISKNVSAGLANLIVGAYKLSRNVVQHNEHSVTEYHVGDDALKLVLLYDFVLSVIQELIKINGGKT